MDTQNRDLLVIQGRVFVLRCSLIYFVDGLCVSLVLKLRADPMNEPRRSMVDRPPSKRYPSSRSDTTLQPFGLRASTSTAIYQSSIKLSPGRNTRREETTLRH